MFSWPPPLDRIGTLINAALNGQSVMMNDSRLGDGHECHKTNTGRNPAIVIMLLLCKLSWDRKLTPRPFTRLTSAYFPIHNCHLPPIPLRHYGSPLVYQTELGFVKETITLDSSLTKIKNTSRPWSTFMFLGSHLARPHI